MKRRRIFTVTLAASIALVFLLLAATHENLIAGFCQGLSDTVASECRGVAGALATAGEQRTVEAAQTGENGWYTVAANPQRTSWTPESIPQRLRPLWFKTFEPYIPQRVQIIAVDNTLYISTSAGLYALDATTGDERWVYATEMPLGHSPTVAGGVAYVGGFDHMIHAIDTATGNGLWTFEAGAGFQTNPLVVGDKLYAGNRDGSFYAIYISGPNEGKLAWKYATGGPILYSAAYQDGVVFFASNDNHAYALNAETGALVWKSEKLPGAGFYSWWPVVYEDRVIFSGSNAYRSAGAFGNSLAHTELAEMYPNRDTESRGTLIAPLGAAPGKWASGTPTIDASGIIQYFQQKPWRRTVFVLDRATGADMEIAPVLWTGNDGAASRYPPVVGADGVLYQQNNYMSSPVIAGGHITGWQPGVPYISVVSSDWGAIDETMAAAAGGNLVYWNLCCDRQAGAFDVTIPETGFAERYNNGKRPPTGPADKNREWIYFSYDLEERIPGYNKRYFNASDDYIQAYNAFGSPNGVYGFHNDNNPPVPHNGRVYMHRSNAIIAFAPSAPDNPPELPMAQSVSAAPVASTPSTTLLQLKLKTEIDKILAAGHLRPGYMSHGHFDLRSQTQCGDQLVDYWHQPADTFVTLIMALPHLPETTQEQVKQYLQEEFAAYAPYAYNHVGWSEGAAREFFDLPPEVQATLPNHTPNPFHGAFKNNGGWEQQGVWGLNPYSFYALWKYAELFGGAQQIYDASKNKLETPPSDELLLKMPLVHNAYIAGYIGYLNLETLAGQPESTAVKNELTRLMQMRAQHFTKDSAYANTASIPAGTYCRTLSVSSNFLYLVPELADYLRQHALPKVVSALDEYEEVAPLWFASFTIDGYAENGHAVLYDGHSIFAAKALIFDEPLSELGKYIDVPVFARGDLYYIQKLVLALENEGSVGFSVYQTFIPTALLPEGTSSR